MDENPTEEAEKRPRYNRFDVEMAKVARDVEHSANVRGNIKAFLKYGSQSILCICATICVWRITGTLPEILDRLANVIREWRMAEITHWIVTAILAIVTWLQRKRLKRFTMKAGDMRHQIEYNDAVNDRSGLAPDGTAAEDEKED